MDHRLVLLAALTTLPTVTLGQSASTRDLSMGGVGVATSQSRTSSFVNPALAQRNRTSDRIRLSAPIFTAVASDEDDLRSGTQELQDSIGVLQDLIAAGDPAADALRPVVADQLAGLAGSEVFVDVGLGIGLVVPRGGVSFGFAWRRFVELRGFPAIDPADFQTIATATDPAELDELASDIVVPSVSVDELGFTVATDFDLFGLPASFGLTPKFQSVETYLYSVSVSDADESDIVGGFDDQGESEREDSANLDVGLAVEVTRAVRAGLAVTNVVAHTFDAPMRDGRKFAYELEALPTLGVAYDSASWTVAVDLELARTSRFQGLDESQFVRIGGEVRPEGWIAVRAGYSHDLERTRQDLWSFGLGFPTYAQGPFDVAFVLGQEGVGGSLQFGWSI